MPNFNFIVGVFAVSLKAIALISLSSFLMIAAAALYFLFSWGDTGGSITHDHLPISLQPADIIETDIYDAVGAGVFQIDQTRMRDFVTTSSFLEFSDGSKASLKLESYDKNVYESGLSELQIDYTLRKPWCGKFHQQAERWLAQPGNYFQYYSESDAGLVVVNPKLNKAIACWYRA